MATFEYEALQSDGKTKSGIATADSARLLRQLLRDQGLTPVSVSISQKKDSRQQVVHQSKMSASQLAVVTRQLATLIGSGMTVEASLSALTEQSEDRQTKSMLNNVRSQVREGLSLVASLQQYPRAFPQIYTASVAAGEATGRLTEVLERLAEFTETRHSVRQKLTAALVYPIILMVVAVVIVVGLLVYVMPKVVRVFTDTGQELPFLTQALIAISDFLRDHGAWILISFVAIFVLISLALRHPGLRFRIHQWFLKMPGIRNFARNINSASMARTLAIMVGSGVPLLASMQSGVDVLSNLAMKDALQKAASEGQEGASLSRTLSSSGYFPPLLTQMIASGEQSGSLSHMLEKSALALERELENRINVLVSLFEPLMILFMGVIVLIIVLSILLPIFDLNQLIR